MEDEDRFSISELADAASVSVRTVRYYIGEGLLPPAVTAGSKSYYTKEHLDRLRVVARLKEGFLPLREIRKHLSEIDDETISQLAAEPSEPPETARPRVPPPLTHYLAEELSSPMQNLGFIAGREDIRPSAPEPNSPGTASQYIASVLSGTVPSARKPWRYSSLHVPKNNSSSPAAEVEPIPAPPVATASTVVSETWRRIEVSEDAELLIREDAYLRRRDKVDWLVDWARKVLD